MIVSSSVTFFFAVRSLKNNSTEIIGVPLKKVLFEEKEWRAIINSKINVDKDQFKNLFLKKLSNQAEVKNITFEYEKNKVLVNLEHEKNHYKWFYNLVQDFVI